MSSTDAFKLFEALALLAAGVAFGWWQLRDVAKAREASRHAAQEREQEAERPMSEAGAAPAPPAPPAPPGRGSSTPAAPRRDP